jgi:hypothetical protein
MSRQPFPERQTIHSDPEDFRGFDPIDIEPWRPGPLMSGSPVSDRSHELALSRKTPKPHA